MNSLRLRRIFLDAACAAVAVLRFTPYRLRPGPTILVVEHRDEFFAHLMRVLAADGYRVERAKSADEATRKLQHGLPALILVNCEQPDESGWLMVSKWELKKVRQRTWLYQGWPAPFDQNWAELTKVERILYHEDAALTLADQVRVQLTLPRGRAA